MLKTCSKHNVTHCHSHSKGIPRPHVSTQHNTLKCVKKHAKKRSVTYQHAKRAQCNTHKHVKNMLKVYSVTQKKHAIKNTVQYLSTC